MAEIPDMEVQVTVTHINRWDILGPVTFSIGFLFGLAVGVLIYAAS